MKQRFAKRGFGKRLSGFTVFLAAGLVLAWIANAAATQIYTWTDEDGIVHYGDTPPDGRETQSIEIEDAYRPGTTDAYPTAEESGQGPAGAGENAAGEEPQSVAQQRREQLAKDRKERREDKALTDQLCARYRQRLAQVEPARRVFITDENGESVRLDDDARMAMVEESKDFIAKNCE